MPSVAEGIDWLARHPRSRLRALGHNLLYEGKLQPDRVSSLSSANDRVPPDYLTDEERAAGHTIVAAHHFYFRLRIDRRLGEPETFSLANALAALPDLEENTWLVRLERIQIPLDLSGTEFPKLLAAVANGHRRDARQHAYVEDFLAYWNSHAPLTPQFAAFETELRDDLRKADWLDRLRIRLGLDHFTPSGGKPLPVALMMYRAGEVRARRASSDPIPHLFVRPTALDQRPNPFFFPAPASLAEGRCMPLVPSGAAGTEPFCEVLHPKFNYRVDHLVRVAMIRTLPPGESLKGLRNDHLRFVRELSGDSGFGSVMGDDVAD